MLKIVLLNNITGQLVGDIPDPVKKRLDIVTSFEVMGSFFAPRFQSHQWDGKKHLLSTLTWRFPLGLFSRIRFVLNEMSVPFEIEDRRINPDIELQDYHLDGIVLRDYQEEAVKVALQRGRGIIKASTGSGKSLIISSIVKAFSKANVTVYVHRNTLLRQLERTFKDVGIKNVGIVGDGEKNPQQITICSVATVTYKEKDDSDVLRFCEENKELMRNSQVLCFDEGHHISSVTFQEICKYSTNAYYRWSFTATPERDDGQDLLLESQIGRLICDISASVLINRGYLTKPNIYFVNCPSIPGASKKEGYPSIYTRGITENALRNQMIAMLAEKCYSEKKTVLISVSKIKHGEILYDLISKFVPEDELIFVQGTGTTGEMKYQVLQDMKARKLKVVVATEVFGEGIDVPGISVVINSKCSKSSVNTYQLVGRALRKHDDKDHATIIDFYDQTMPYLKSHSSKRIEILSKEPEYNIIRVKNISEVVL